MPTATYEPQNTTGSVADLAGAEQSLSPLPSGEDYVLIPGGWLPREQEYYWTAEWQAAERETLDQIAAGEGVEFDNATDLIRWLFGTDDD